MKTLALSPSAPTAARPRRQATAPADARRRGWIERLAAWAERQPSHRRLGSWTRA